MHSWNLFDWQRRLGIRRKDQPELVPAVQPVVMLGDHSGLASQILPPLAWMGGHRTAIALEKTVLQLTSRAPGGSYVRWLDIDSSGVNLCFFGLGARVTLNNALVLTKYDFGGEPTLSTLELGTFVGLPPALPTNACPTIQVTNSAATSYQDLVYIPPGNTFLLCSQQDQVGIDCAVMFEDCLAARGAE